MRTASSAFKDIIKSSSRNFINTAVITLTSQEQITVTNANILFNGLEVEDSVGSDGTFDVVGSTIINSCTLMLYNGNDEYSSYDFDGAVVVVSTGLIVNGANEPIQLGRFIVEDANYTANSIVLSLLDNMSKFDRPYSESQLVYPATLAQIVSDACNTCGVEFNSVGSDFTYDTFVVNTKPDGKSCTFRDVIGWAATINCVFARCNSIGQLEFKWFDLSGRPITTDNIIVIDENDVEHEHVSLILNDGTIVNTISYIPGKNKTLPEISSLFSQDIAISDITITGLTISVANVEDDADITSSVGTDDYRITISDNPFITTDNITTVRDQIAERIIGLSFRKCSVSCISNPLLEAGDTAYLIDTKGNEHRILITRVTFSPTANQVIVCGADTPNRKSAILFGASTRISAQLKSHIRALREKVIDTETIAGNTNQYFWFTETGTDTGAHITEIPQEEFTDPNSENYHAGYNALFRSIGFAIRNGLVELATFSANSIRLGLASAKHILINTDGISLYSAANTLLSSFTSGAVQLYVSGTLRTILSTTGLTVYDDTGVNAVAQFGETSQIGKDTANHQVIDTTGIKGINTDGDTIFDIDMDGGLRMVPEFTRVQIENPVRNQVDMTTLTFTPVFPNIPAEAVDGRELQWSFKIVFTKSDNSTVESYFGIYIPNCGENLTRHGSSGSITSPIRYDFQFTYTSAYSSTSGENECTATFTIRGIDSSYVSAEYWCEFYDYYRPTYIKAPAFSLGTRFDDTIGAFSGIVGEGLSAQGVAQFACGRYNVYDSDYAFMVGNGNVNTDSNAFAITWDGNQLLALDEEATTGIDADLYSAITALGWEDEVLI